MTALQLDTVLFTGCNDVFSAGAQKLITSPGSDVASLVRVANQRLFKKYAKPVVSLQKRISTVQKASRGLAGGGSHHPSDVM